MRKRHSAQPGDSFKGAEAFYELVTMKSRHLGAWLEQMRMKEPTKNLEDYGKNVKTFEINFEAMERA